MVSEEKVYPDEMSQKRKKQEAEEIGVKNHNLGCMWGIFHNLQQNRWPKVVKRLPLTRLGHGKHSTAPAQDKAVIQENADAPSKPPRPDIKHNAEAPNPAHRNSIKSRIKALITEEVHRRKIRNKSTSCPAPAPAVKEPEEDNNDDDNNNNNIPSALPEPPLPLPNVRVNYLKQTEVDQLGEQQPVKDHTFLHGNLVYAIEPTKDDSLNESKLFMNALNLLNMREEMFMAILKDPTSSLVHKNSKHSSSNLRYGLGKSISFSAPPSSDTKDDSSIAQKCEEDRGEANPSVDNTVAKKSDDRVGLMRFKNIKEKIKYVIRDKKKEKNRIMMDALHHKVPFGKSASQKISEDIENQGSDFGNSSTQAAYNRTPSFNNSLDRYNQLIDIGSRKEGKDHISDESKLKVVDTKPAIRNKPATLGRIHSSPAIRSYLFPNNTDEKSDIVSGGNIQLGRTDMNEEKPVNQLDSEDRVMTSENGNQEEVIAIVADSVSTHDLKDKSETSSFPQPLKPETNEAADLEAGEKDDLKDKSEISSFPQPLKPETNEAADLEAGEKDLSRDLKDESEISSFSPPETNEAADLEAGESHDLKEESETSPFPQPSKPETEAAADLEAGERGSSSHDLEGESQTSLSPQSSKSETDEVSVNHCENHKDEASASDDSRLCEGLYIPTKEDSSDLVDNDTPEIEKQTSNSCHLSDDMIDLDIEGELDKIEPRVSQEAVGIVQESQIPQVYNEQLRVQGDVKHNAEFNYVKEVLELSGFSGNESLREWQSVDYPLDPQMFEEVGGDQHDCYGHEDGISNQLLLFDMINEVLLQVHERSFFYWPTPLTNRSSIHPLPEGSRVLEEVWTEMRWLLKSMPSSDSYIDGAVSHDLAKNDGWMNLQLDAECVGIELEELILNDLLQENFVG